MALLSVVVTEGFEEMKVRDELNEAQAKREYLRDEQQQKVLGNLPDMLDCFYGREELIWCGRASSSLGLFR